MPRQQSDIGQRRMRAVEHAQLRGLIGRGVGNEFRPDRIPSRTRASEIILDHPLAECFGDHRAFIAHAQHRLDRRAVGIGRRGHNAIDHRRGASAGRIEPCLLYTSRCV